MKKGLIATLALGAAALTLAAAIDARAQTTVTMWTFLDITKNTPRERALRDMIASFEKENPGIKIKVEPQVWSTMTEKFVLAAGSKTAPDISWANAENLGVLMSADVAADLNDLIMKGWSKEERDDFVVQDAFASTNVKGKQHAMPLMVVSNAIMYRKDLFAAAGVDAGSLKTWDQFANAMKKVTKPGVSGFGMALNQDRATLNPIVSAVLATQDNLFDDKCELKIANENGARALQMQADFIAKHKVTPQETFARNSDDNMDQFTAGRYAAISGPLARFEKTREEVPWGGQNLGIMAWPNWTEGKPSAYVISGWFAAVWKDSPRRKEAARFVEHMVKPEAATLWTFPGGQLPLRKVVMKHPDFQKPENDWMRFIAEQWAQSGKFLPPNCIFTRVMGDLNVATQKVALGQAKAMDALKEVEKKHLERQ